MNSSPSIMNALLITGVIILCIQIHTTLSCSHMEKVQRCPKNKEEWIERATVLNCPKTFRNDTYHCVLDSDGIRLMELCVPNKIIRGRKCTEFNAYGHTIQESSISCTTECPYKYNSTDAYKFQSCYEEVYKNARCPYIVHTFGISIVNLILIAAVLFVLLVLLKLGGFHQQFRVPHQKPNERMLLTEK